MNCVEVRRVVRRAVDLVTDADVLLRYLEDAAHYPGGSARAVARPATVEEVAWLVDHAAAVLPVGAQSSLTGGATPRGEVVLSTERLTRLEARDDTVVAGAGVTLLALQEALAARGAWFPPVPTFLGATVGGAIATNAAGAATFKYGAVRRWVRALDVVLANGDLLRLRRGDAMASAEGTFVFATSSGRREVPVPRLTMPAVPKCSAGYFSAPRMDPIDLFIGSEGTLGVIVEAELAVAPRPAGVCWVFIPLPDESAAIALAGSLRTERALDLAAIEHLDARSIEVLREDGVDRRLGVRVPDEAAVLLLVQLELSADEVAAGMSDARATLLADLLSAHAALESAEIVLPSNPRRAAALVELREAVPAGVNRRVARAHAIDPRIHKTAADMIVPFGRFAEMMATCRQLCEAERLDLAVWGHISDGNVHPNVIPRDFDEMERGRAVIVELGRRVVGMGGSPLAEHGVGRNTVKQHLLAMLYGGEGIESMRAVKKRLDPGWKLAPGLLFEKPTSCDAG